jgi:hypothetical protein
MGANRSLRRKDGHYYRMVQILVRRGLTYLMSNSGKIREAVWLSLISKIVYIVCEKHIKNW